MKRKKEHPYLICTLISIILTILSFTLNEDVGPLVFAISVLLLVFGNILLLIIRSIVKISVKHSFSEDELKNDSEKVQKKISDTYKKTLIITLSLIVIIVLVIIGTANYYKNSQFANEIYLSCLDNKSSSINIDSLYSDSYKAVTDCEKVRSKAFSSRKKYETCISDEKEKMGTNFEDYIEYLWGGYIKDYEHSGYYLGKSYEYYASLYKDKTDAFVSAYKKLQNTCMSRIIK